MHLVEWSFSLSQLQTNSVLLSPPSGHFFLILFLVGSVKGPGGAWQRTGLWDFVQLISRNIHVWAGNFLYMTLSCISVSKINTCCISYKNCPSGAQLKFPKHFLALKIVGKAQECDLSVTGCPTGGVDEPFRCLISCCGLGWLEAPLICRLTPLVMSSSAHADGVWFPTQMHTCVDFASWILQEGFLVHRSHQTGSLILTRSHLWETQLFPASITLWIPKSTEAVRQLISQKQVQLGSTVLHQGLTVAPCSWLMLVWSRMPPAATQVAKILALSKYELAHSSYWGV